MKKYILEIEHYDNEVRMKSKNDGLTAMEIIGYLEWKKRDIFNQVEGIIEPDTVRREVVEDE